MFKNSNNKTTVALLVLLLIIFGFYFYKEFIINKSKVYVIGKMKKASFEGGEMGWIYDLEYYYDSIRYQCTFSGPLKEYITNDSLLLIAISKAKPNYSKPAHFIVPCHFKIKDVPKLGWSKIPDCTK